MPRAMLLKILPNLCVLAALAALYAGGQFFDLSAIQNVFERIDDLTGNLLLVLVAITMGILVERYVLVAASVAAISGLMIFAPGLFPFGDISSAQIAAVAFMLLGFSSVANIFRHTRQTIQ